MRGGGLRAGEGILVRLSAALAAGDRARLREVMGEAARPGTAEEVEEVILQAYLFLGYPASLNAFALWREVSGRPAPAPAPDGPEVWERRGEEVCSRVYGGQYGALRANVRALHPDMEHWMVVEGYGKVLGREGLSLRVRELCIVALLAVLNVPRQLYSHLRGALNVGASPEEVEAALEEAVRWAGPDAAAAAEATWREVRARTAGRSGSP